MHLERFARHGAGVAVADHGNVHDGGIPEVAPVVEVPVVIIGFVRPDHQIGGACDGVVDDDSHLCRVNADGRSITGHRADLPDLLVVRKMDGKEPEVILKLAFVDLEVAADQHKDQIASVVGVEHGLPGVFRFDAETVRDLLDRLASGRVHLFQRKFRTAFFKLEPGDRDFAVRLVAFSVRRQENRVFTALSH